MRTEKWQMYLECLQGHPSVCQSSHTKDSMSFLKQHINPQTHPRILNIGPGEGLETWILKNMGFNPTGLVWGALNLEFGRKNYPDVDFVEGDMHDLPFVSGSFDAIYLNHVFEHTFSPFIFLLEMYCVLRKNGRVWIAMPEFKELDDPTIEEPNRLYHHHPNMLSYNFLVQMFEATGFKVIYKKKIDKNPYFDNPYLLEKQSLDCLHSDVKMTVLNRKLNFG